MRCKETWAVTNEEFEQVGTVLNRFGMRAGHIGTLRLAQRIVKVVSMDAQDRVNADGGVSHTRPVVCFSRTPHIVGALVPDLWRRAGRTATQVFAALMLVFGLGMPAMAQSPTVSIEGVPLTSERSFTATFIFSENVTGFAVADITVGNGAASGLTGVDGERAYTALITPTANGSVTVDVAAGVAMDDANNGNTAATQATSTYTASSGKR